jgi:transcriptional regulator with XRE-family HTH domain
MDVRRWVREGYVTPGRLFGLRWTDGAGEPPAIQVGDILTIVETRVGIGFHQGTLVFNRTLLTTDKRRLELKLTQKDAARQLGMNSPITVLNWERGKTQPPTVVMVRIIGFLGYDPLPASREVSRSALSPSDRSWVGSIEPRDYALQAATRPNERFEGLLGLYASPV